MSRTEHAVENQERQELLDDIHVGALCRVEAFDPEHMTVDLQPLSKTLSGGTYRTPPPILRVPVALIRGGGLVLRPWYSEGDVGVVVYMDHDIDAITEDGRECQPNTERSHSQEDAVFIGAFSPSSKPMPDLPEGALAMGTLDGSVYLAVSKSGISIKGSVSVTGDVVAQGVSLAGHTHTAPDGQTSKPD